MYSDTPLENRLDQIANEVAQQQQIQFSSLGEAHNHLKRIKSDLRHLVEQGNKTLMHGLAHLSNNPAHEFVAHIAGKLLKHIDSSKKINKIIETEIFGNDQSLRLFADAIESYLDSGDLEREYSVLTVLLVLFPNNPQPYLYFGTSIERTDGAAVAAAYYAEVVKVFPHPVIFYFGAECFFKIGDKVKTKQLLQNGIGQARQAPELHSDIEMRLARFAESI